MNEWIETNWLVILIGIIYIAACYLIIVMKRRKASFNKRVLSALGIGLALGFFTQIIANYAADSETSILAVKTFLSIFGDGYVALLQIVVIPLIFLAMISSIMNLKEEKALSRIVPKVLAVLIITVAIAASLGVVASMVFGLDKQAESLVHNQNTIYTDSTSVLAKAESLQTNSQEFADTDYAETIVSFIPENIFAMLTGAGKNATLSTVLIGMFIGYCTLQVRKRKPEKVQSFVSFVESSKEVVLSMVREILKLTPFGVMALMTIFMATNNYTQLSSFVIFIIASYVAMVVMYLVHLLIIFLTGLNPIIYVKKTISVLIFGFSSRSSMATLPLTVETQMSKLGVDEETANISATFGTSIGQNGCAGIYPTMVAIMTLFAEAAMNGTEAVLTIGFVLKLIIVVAISSFGIAGVGGGATFAAIAVLQIMGLDLTYVALLVAIEPLIDMARTALNISDSMVAGVVTSRLNKTIDTDVYNSETLNDKESVFE